MKGTSWPTGTLMDDVFGPGTPPWELVDTLYKDIIKMAREDPDTYSIESLSKFICDALPEDPTWLKGALEDLYEEDFTLFDYPTPERTNVRSR